METLALVIGIAVVLFVPALVWITVIAGLIQIVYKKWVTHRSVINWTRVP